jgi:hypothetical protein
LFGGIISPFTLFLFLIKGRLINKVLAPMFQWLAKMPFPMLITSWAKISMQWAKGSWLKAALGTLKLTFRMILGILNHLIIGKILNMLLLGFSRIAPAIGLIFNQVLLITSSIAAFISGLTFLSGGLLILAVASVANFFRVVYNNWSMIASLGWSDIPIMFQGILNNWKVLGTLIGQHLTNIGSSISRLFSSINSWFINQLNRIPGVNLSSNNAAPLSTEPIVSSQSAVASNSRSVNVNLYGTRVAMTSDELGGMLNRWTNQQAFV